MTAQWKLVPVEPTDAMLEVIDDAAMFDEGGYLGQEEAVNVYRAVLAAAPTIDPGLIAQIITRGMVNQQSHIHGGRFYVVGLDMAALPEKYDDRDEAEEVLTQIKVNAILSIMGNGGAS